MDGRSGEEVGVDNVIVPIQREIYRKVVFGGGVWMVFYGVKGKGGLINKGSEVDLEGEGFQG